MTILDFEILYNAIRVHYKPYSLPAPVDDGLRHLHDVLEHLVKFMKSNSNDRAYSLEIHPPVYRDSHLQQVYTLSQPPAKASYNGLSLTEYEKLMDVMMESEMHQARCAADTAQGCHMPIYVQPYLANGSESFVLSLACMGCVQSRYCSLHASLEWTVH